MNASLELKDLFEEGFCGRMKAFMMIKTINKNIKSHCIGFMFFIIQGYKNE
jgi:hypothetical protein